jgi:hypothetical protein
MEATTSGESGVSRSEEVIVASEVVRLDAHLVGLASASDDRLGRLAQARGEAPLVDVGAHIASAEGAGPERRLDTRDHLRLAVARDEALELVDLGAQVDAASRDLLEVDAARLGEGRDAVLALRPLGAGPAVEEFLDMLGLLDGATALPRARMLGDDLGAIDDADARVVGADDTLLPTSPGGTESLLVSSTTRASLPTTSGMTRSVSKRCSGRACRRVRSRIRRSAGRSRVVAWMR